jgi:hypothetical protein
MGNAGEVFLKKLTCYGRVRMMGITEEDSQKLGYLWKIPKEGMLWWGSFL